MNTDKWEDIQACRRISEATQMLFVHRLNREITLICWRHWLETPKSWSESGNGRFVPKARSSGGGGSKQAVEPTHQWSLRNARPLIFNRVINNSTVSICRKWVRSSAHNDAFLTWKALGFSTQNLKEHSKANGHGINHSMKALNSGQQKILGLTDPLLECLQLETAGKLLPV